MNKNIPAQYRFLENEGAPRMLVEALKLVGIKEVFGSQHAPEIMALAKECGLEKIYLSDETPWCGLAMAAVARRAGKTIPFSGYNILRALKWAEFGTPVAVAKLGDVLVFTREGGGHVGLYVGEDKTHYHVLGGNQSNSFSFTRIAKARCSAISRPEYKTGMPKNVRQIGLSATGAISQNEA